jgi:uncharacterized protein YoxC
MPGAESPSRRLQALEAGQREGNRRLARIEGSLVHVIEVLELHSRQFDRMEVTLVAVSDRVDRLGVRVDNLSERVDDLSVRVDKLTERVDGLTVRVDGLTVRVDRIDGRVDRLTKAIARGRTQDLARFDELDGRLRALETRGRPPTS